MIDLAGIGAVISGMTGLLVTAGTFMLQRQRRQAVDADDIEDELEIRNEQWLVAIRHVRAWEDYHATNSDLPPLARPPELKAGYFQERQQSGRKRRVGRHAAPADDGAAEGQSA